MSMQADLRNPEFGYFDEGMNLMDEQVYAPACRLFGEATTLPPVAYRSKVFFELENEKIWTRSWVAIGLLQQIPRPGDMLPFTLGFHGVHVQRNADGSISARMNRHQHGGCRFVPEQCRTGAQTKCSITSCNYTRDADVMPGGPEGENTDVMYKFVGLVPERLAPVKCETFGPFIFINLDPECRPLAEQFEELPDIPWSQLKLPMILKQKQWLDFRCNWKTIGSAFTGAVQRSGHSANAALRVSWLFPNVLLAVGGGRCVIVLLQATGMGKCLCRFFLLESESRDSAQDQFALWLTFLKASGATAEEQQHRLAALGTSWRPGTTADEVSVESNWWTYRLNQFLASRLTLQHHYYWNAPIMDAAMMTRGFR